MDTVVHHIDPGGQIVLIICGICYCAVLERFWDKHVDMHRDRGETE
jgi:hypothetical protein